MLLAGKPKGTRDVLPEETAKWRILEGIIDELCRVFNYGEIRTPMFEHTELFLRGVGDTTDVVGKEMYTFEDRGGRSLTLRPECTTSTVRAYLENAMVSAPQPIKLYYVGPMFRYDKPQAGRYKQFTQFGLEAIGSSDPAIDAEVIMLAMEFFKRLNLTGLKLLINNIGCPKCRTAYRETLIAYFAGNKELLCKDCKDRLEKNPLRVLDCKVPVCKKLAENAPIMLDSLCEECSDHFTQVKSYLDALGIAYTISGKLVRGLDYYTKTVFEIVTADNGTDLTICGGGRYDGLVELCGGKPTPGIGFATGLERVLLAMEKAGNNLTDGRSLECYVASLGISGKLTAMKMAAQLRGMGISTEVDFQGRSLKSQMKQADKLGAKFVVMIGDNELATGQYIVKNMNAGNQVEIESEAVVEYIAKCLKGETQC